MHSDLLTAQELSQKLGLTVETIWRYTRERKIPAIVVGTRQYRYDLEKVLEKLQTKTHEDERVKERKNKYALGPYTYQDYAAFCVEPGYTIQLIDGCVVKDPAPILHHQRVSRRLQRILEDYFLQINPQGELFNAPVDVVFSEHTIVQPDLVYVGDTEQLTNPKYIDIVPELIVEILSSSSKRTDKLQKLNLYLRHGVLHYWIVDPENGIMEALKQEKNNYVVVTVEDGDFKHPDFPNLSFNIADLVAKPI